MFLGVLQFNLFSFVIFCDDKIQTLPDWALLMDQIAFPMCSADYYTDLTHHKNSDQKTQQKDLFANSYESQILTVSFSALSQNHLYD